MITDSRKLAAEVPGRPDAWAVRDLGIKCHSVRRASRAAPRSCHDAQTGRPPIKAVEEFLVHAVKYAFPAQRGEPTRGLPTAHAAAPLRTQIASAGDLPPVWPDPDGEVRGGSFEPLHRAVPNAARKDPRLYELLALIDALRDGRVRERQLAEKALSALLRSLLRG